MSVTYDRPGLDGLEELPGVIGRSILRVEDDPLLRGDGMFLDDLCPEQTLHLAFVRSVHAHADVRGVDLTAARAHPGVAFAFGPAELRAVPPLTPQLVRPGAAVISRPILAGARVRFVGEAIAAVVASSRYLAEDAAEMVDVDYEPLVAVCSVEDALRDDLPSLHDGFSNVIFKEQREIGAVDEAFRSAAVVVERTFRNPRYNAVPIEPRGVLAIPGRDGLVVWSSTQIPHVLESSLEELLGLEGRVEVRCPDVGGGFGQKAHVYPEEIAVAWAALRLGLPVKWAEDRVESLQAATHAREQLVRARLGVDRSGRIVALEADVYSNVGAYAIYPWGQILESLGTPAILPGPYDVRNYRYSTHSLASNKGPQGAYRGVGLPVAAFVHERLMDIAAGELGLDPAEIRRINFVPPEAFPYRSASGLTYDSGDYRAALDLALEQAGYADFPAEQAEAAQAGRRIGLGIGSYVEYTGTNSETYRSRGMSNVLGYDAGRVRINADGTVTVWTSCPAIGQGTATTFSQIVAHHLGVPFELVKAELVDTADSPRGSGTFASRSAISAGGALISVSGQIRERLVELAAEALEADPDDLVVAGGFVGVRGSLSDGLTLAELFARAEPGYLDIGEPYDPEQTAFAYATHVAVVEVDVETGAVEILRYVIAEDCGTVINPIIVEGQVHGATAQGIGGTLFESLRFSEDGQLQTASLMDYLVPTSCELPVMVVHHLETPAPGLRGGFKGVGEGGSLGPPGALANAVGNALGIEINELPIQPEHVVSALAASTV